MCSPFSSCAGSFKNCDDIDELPSPIKLASKKSSKIRNWKSFSFSSSSISSRRSRSDRNSIDNKSTKKNSFASQGLDKFSTLLAELEVKKQKIYTQKDSQDISMVYFTYSSEDELQPLIMKVKKQQPQPKLRPKKPIATKINVSPIKEKEVVLIKKPLPVNQEVFHVSSKSVADEKKVSQRYIPMAAKKLWSSMLGNMDQRQIFSFFLVTIIFILVLLLFGGRSFAVFCLTVAWYLVPTMLSEETAIQPPVTYGRKPVSRSSTFK